jgi:hypothetical protein
MLLTVAAMLVVGCGGDGLGTASKPDLAPDNGYSDTNEHCNADSYSTDFRDKCWSTGVPDGTGS